MSEGKLTTVKTKPLFCPRCGAGFPWRKIILYVGGGDRMQNLNIYTDQLCQTKPVMMEMFSNHLPSEIWIGQLRN
jgi:hypothetical protein